MKKIPFYSTLVSIIFAFVAYLGTNSFIVAGIVLIASISYFFLLFHKEIKKYVFTINRFHECYTFINNFIVSLSITDSFSGSLESTSQAMGEDFKEEIEGIRDMKEIEKLQYLEKYFPFHVFKLFFNTVCIQVEEGGDIIKMSQFITDDIRETEEYITHSNSVIKRKAFEIGTLWLFTFFILIVLRFALQDLFQSFSKELIFQLCVGGIFFIALISIELFTRRFTSIKIKGADHEE